MSIPRKGILPRWRFREDFICVMRALKISIWRRGFTAVCRAIIRMLTALRWNSGTPARHAPYARRQLVSRLKPQWRMLRHAWPSILPACARNIRNKVFTSISHSMALTIPDSLRRMKAKNNCPCHYIMRKQRWRGNSLAHTHKQEARRGIVMAEMPTVALENIGNCLNISIYALYQPQYRISKVSPHVDINEAKLHLSSNSTSIFQRKWIDAAILALRRSSFEAHGVALELFFILDILIIL